MQLSKRANQTSSKSSLKFCWINSDVSAFPEKFFSLGVIRKRAFFLKELFQVFFKLVLKFSLFLTKYFKIWTISKYYKYSTYKPITLQQFGFDSHSSANFGSVIKNECRSLLVLLLGHREWFHSLQNRHLPHCYIFTVIFFGIPNFHVKYCFFTLIVVVIAWLECTRPCFCCSLVIT